MVVMEVIHRYTNFIPYLYFIAITAYWFTTINQQAGISAYPILLFAIPFVWQVIKPSHKLNFSLGIVFVCLSSYLILAYLSNTFNLPPIVIAKGFIIYGGLFVLLNFFMSLWIVRNSLKRTF